MSVRQCTTARETALLQTDNLTTDMEIRSSMVRIRDRRATDFVKIVALAWLFGFVMVNGQTESPCMKCLKYCAAEWDNFAKLFVCHSCLARDNCKSGDLSLFFFDYHCEPSPVTERITVSLLQVLSREQRSRFMNQTTAHAPTVRKQGGRDPSVRSYMGRAQGSQLREVCPTTTKIQSPHTAEHISGLIVRLASMPGYRQYFFLGECRYSRPVITMIPPGRCKTVKRHHKAIFTVSERQMVLKGRSLFQNCHLLDPVNKHYLCDDWVKLNSTCSLFI